MLIGKHDLPPGFLEEQEQEREHRFGLVVEKVIDNALSKNPATWQLTAVLAPLLVFLPPRRGGAAGGGSSSSLSSAVTKPAPKNQRRTTSDDISEGLAGMQQDLEKQERYLAEKLGSELDDTQAAGIQHMYDLLDDVKRLGGRGTLLVILSVDRNTQHEHTEITQQQCIEDNTALHRNNTGSRNVPTSPHLQLLFTT